MDAVALARSDRTLILVTTGALILAGLFFASVLIFATGRSSPDSTQQGPLYIGPRHDIVLKLDEGSPLYFANPFGGRGFWIDREAGEIMAFDVGRWQSPSCSVRWKGRVDSYVDCDGERLTKADLARHPVTVLTRGERKGSVYVDLDELEAPPGSVSTE
jgi:hypothetical protein